MLQQTVERIKPLMSEERIFIATGTDYYHLVREQLPGVPLEKINAEPVGRDTAPRIGLATLFIERKYPNAVILVLLADHLIADTPSFLSCLSIAARHASKGYNIVTLGIKLDRAETGYGYTHVGEILTAAEQWKIYRVKAFIEKPDRQKRSCF